MTETTSEAFYSFVNERQEYACTRLRKDADYNRLCERQKQSEEIVEELYQHFDEDEYLSIVQHYEGETDLENCRLDAVYIQGLRDCFELITFLSDEEDEVQL